MPVAAVARAQELWENADALVVLGQAAQASPFSSILSKRGNPDQVCIAIGPGDRPKWADAHIPEAMEAGIRVLARETSTNLGE